jgi:hypothetical protein
MAGLTSAASVSGAVTTLYGAFLDLPTINAGAAITNWTGLYIGAPAKSNVTGAYKGDQQHRR